jgi:hypothetical protein
LVYNVLKLHEKNCNFHYDLNSGTTPDRGFLSSHYLFHMTRHFW